MGHLLRNTSGLSPDIITLAGLVLTIIGLALSVKAMYDSRAVVTQMQSVAEVLTTNRVGESPDYIEELVRLVSRCKRSLCITSVFPGVGLYSAPDSWVHLETAIKERHAAGVRVELLVGSDEAMRDGMKAQYADALKDWEKYREHPTNARRLRRFAQRYQHARPQFETYQEFEDFAITALIRTIKEVFWEARIEYTSDFIPLITWISDEREAFFAIANDTGRNTGFVTRDANMIRSFRSVKARYGRISPPGEFPISRI